MIDILYARYIKKNLILLGVLVRKDLHISMANSSLGYQKYFSSEGYTEEFILSTG